MLYKNMTEWLKVWFAGIGEDAHIIVMAEFP